RVNEPEPLSSVTAVPTVRSPVALRVTGPDQQTLPSRASGASAPVVCKVRAPAWPFRLAPAMTMALPLTEAVSPAVPVKRVVPEKLNPGLGAPADARGSEMVNELAY